MNNSFLSYLKSGTLLLGGISRWLVFLIPPLGLFGPYELNVEGLMQVSLFEIYLLIGWYICYLISKLNIDIKDINGKRMFITDVLNIFIIGALAAILGILIFDKL